jgi:hypothetical protein
LITHNGFSPYPQVCFKMEYPNDRYYQGTNKDKDCKEAIKRLKKYDNLNEAFIIIGTTFFYREINYYYFSKLTTRDK